jgi:thiamine pyrophosphokinase
MQQNSSALVLAGGPMPSLDWARPIVSQAAIVVCADSGWRLCRACGVRPLAVVGDLDSLTAAEIAELSERGIAVERYPAAKNESDLHLALARLSRDYQGSVDILGALGGRLDHTLFNVCAVLLLARSFGLQARLVEPDTLVLPLEKSLRLSGWRGRQCSILPLTAEIRGLTLTGFRYGLHRETLTRVETRGLSNVVESDDASLTYEEGEGLLVVSWAAGEERR